MMRLNLAKVGLMLQVDVKECLRSVVAPSSVSKTKGSAITMKEAIFSSSFFLKLWPLMYSLTGIAVVRARAVFERSFLSLCIRFFIEYVFICFSLSGGGQP